MSDSSLSQLLSRTSLTIPFETVLSFIEKEYPHIGTITNTIPILEGYEAANIILQTSNGRYVLKIFEKDRNPANIDSLTRIHLEAPTVSVPVPTILQGKQGFLSTFPAIHPVPFFLTEYVDGTNFEHALPSMNDMVEITTLIARLNTVDFPVTEAYDSWGNKNLIQEFEKNKTKLPSDAIQLISPVVEKMKTIPLHTFSKSVIHGDMQRKHVLKNEKGEYCILDFGCMSYDAKVIDLSTFLAWFCLTEKNWSDRQKIFDTVLATYDTLHHLTLYEHQALWPLVQASYAAYYLKTTVLLKEGDTSEQTALWHTQSFHLLQLSQSVRATHKVGSQSSGSDL